MLVGRERGTKRGGGGRAGEEKEIETRIKRGREEVDRGGVRFGDDRKG